MLQEIQIRQLLISYTHSIGVGCISPTFNLLKETKHEIQLYTCICISIWLRENKEMMYCLSHYKHMMKIALKIGFQTLLSISILLNKLKYLKASYNWSINDQPDWEEQSKNKFLTIVRDVLSTNTFILLQNQDLKQINFHDENRCYLLIYLL